MADRIYRSNRTISTDKQIKNKMTIKKWIYNVLKGAHLRTKIVLAFHSRNSDIVKKSISKTYNKYRLKRYMWYEYNKQQRSQVRDNCTVLNQSKL